jgi:hypothetical protein
MNVDAGHGGFLMDGAWRARVVAGIMAVAGVGSARAAEAEATAGFRTLVNCAARGRV